MTAMIEVSHLSKRFGPIAAIDDLSFAVDRGEVLGFLGPNGAGKSTTMKMITGFLAPDAGRVTVGGDDVARAPVAVKRRIGYLPEGAPLYGDMTPLRFLDFIAQVRGLRGQDKRRRIDEVIERVNIGNVAQQRIETLSKGYKRRVGLAQAIVHDPEVLILDEPTDGLDPNQKHEVRTLIHGMAKDKAIILSTHILEEVDAVCSRAIIIAQGRIVADGTPAELQARSEQHNAITLSVRGAGAGAIDQALGALDGIERVQRLESPEGSTRLRILPRDRRPLVAAIGQAAREHGWDIEELHVEHGRLDEVFRAITRAAPGGAA